MERIIQSAATSSSQPRRTELRGSEGREEEEEEEEEEERGLRRVMPFSLGRARVAGTQISWGRAKINCLL